jgi:hypothetical protein
MRRITLAAALLVLSGCGTDVSGPPASLFGCVFGQSPSLQVGEVVGFSGAGNRALCLTAPSGDAAFVYVPFFAAPSRAEDSSYLLAVDVLGTGISPSGSGFDPDLPPVIVQSREPSPGYEGPPTAARELRLGGSVHRWLREREIAELEPRIRGGHSAPDGGAAARSAMAPLPAEGDLMELNVALSCSTHRTRTGRVMRVSQRAVLLADVGNPGNGFTAADYAHFAASFDTLIHPVATRHFGPPSDIDGNDRILIFFTRAVNELTASGSTTITAGVFWSGDLFPVVATPRLESCPASNQAEIFYMAVPDATGSVGPEIKLDWLRPRAIQIMGHEYQHLLNSARRLHVNESRVFEQTWLNEGLSHIAEELLFFEASGLRPGSNIGSATLDATPGARWAYERYMASNDHNLRQYLQRLFSSSPMGADNLGTRGGAWSFLRYAADRAGAGDESMFFRLVNSTTAGLDNLDAVLGVSSLVWMHDWALALYADDHVPGVDPRHTLPSWDFRDIHASRGQGYPLSPIALREGSHHRENLQPGGAALLGFGIEPGGRAVIHVEADGATPPRSLRGSFLRIR